jgi:hypothetical protein
MRARPSLTDVDATAIASPAQPEEGGMGQGCIQIHYEFERRMQGEVYD